MFAPEVEVWAIELPGHGSRIREAAETRLGRLAAAIAAELTNVGLAERPFAFFGHSMGGLLAFEVARVLRPIGAPKYFFASGCHAPQLGFADTPIHALPAADFLEVMVQRYGGIPDAILREKELLDLILPTLRADMAMVETHRYEPGAPFACPLTVMAGVDDLRATAEVLGGWVHQTTGGFELLRFPGGHFYLQPGIGEVVAEIGKRLAGLCGRASSE